MERKYLNLLQLNPIDDPIAAEVQLPDRFVRQLWHNPAKAGVASQAIRRLKGPLSKYSSDPRRVSSNEQTDGIKIINSLKSPTYRSQRAMRRRAFSWVMRRP